MERKPVKSGNIKSVGYEKDNSVIHSSGTIGTLEIEFSNGDVYQYANVPEELYQSMMGASSVGKFFNDYVKTVYRVSKMQPSKIDYTVPQPIGEPYTTKNVTSGTITDATYDPKIVGSILADADTIEGWKIANRESLTDDALLFDKLKNLRQELKDYKPNDKSDKDRFYAVTLTELEKLIAYFSHWVVAQDAQAKE